MTEEVNQGVEVEAFDALTVARGLLDGPYATPGGQPGLLMRGEKQWIKWSRGAQRWEALGHAELRGELWLLLEKVSCTTENQSGSVQKFFVPTRDKVREIMEALEPLCRWEEKLPAWLGGGEGRPAADHCVAFEDYVVDVKGTAQERRESGDGGRWVVVERDETWIGAVVPCKFEPEARCRVYEEKCGQWTPDQKDLELRERFYGYCLMSTRKYRRGLSEFGKAHGGKGSWTRLLRAMKGAPWYYGIQLMELSDGHQSGGLASCDVLVVSECNDLDGREGGRCASLVKASWGQDTVTINRKHIEQESVVLGFAPIFQGNSMLSLPDDNGGISGKLLWIHFKESFVGKEDPELDEKLQGEMAGIAARWVSAAVRLEAAEAGSKWCMGSGGAEVARRYRLEANPWDAFVEACFVMSRGGFVESDLVKRQRKEWEKRTGIRLVHKDGRGISDQDLLRCVEENTTRAVKRKKVRRKMGDVEVQRRGLEGVAVRAQMALGEERE